MNVNDRSSTVSWRKCFLFDASTHGEIVLGGGRQVSTYRCIKAANEKRKVKLQNTRGNRRDLLVFYDIHEHDLD